jgi:hypothetical protein
VAGECGGPAQRAPGDPGGRSPVLLPPCRATARRGSKRRSTGAEWRGRHAGGSGGPARAWRGRGRRWRACGSGPCRRGPGSRGLPAASAGGGEPQDPWSRECPRNEPGWGGGCPGQGGRVSRRAARRPRGGCWGHRRVARLREAGRPRRPGPAGAWRRLQAPGRGGGRAVAPLPGAPRAAARFGCRAAGSPGAGRRAAGRGGRGGPGPGPGAG